MEAVREYGDRIFIGNKTYLEVYKIVKLLPTLKSSRIAVLFSDCQVSTIITILHILSHGASYIPITIKQFPLSQCSKVEFSLTKGFSGGIKMCEEHLKRQALHCNWCSVWCNIALQLSRFHGFSVIVDQSVDIKDCSIELNRSYLLSLSLSVPLVDCMNCRNSGVGKQLSTSSDDPISYCITTSGTTGTPKTVSVPSSCIVPNIDFFTNQFDIKASDGILQCSPLTFDPSIVEIFCAVRAGARLILVSTAVKVNSKQLVRLIKTEAVSILMCTPSFLRAFNRRQIKSLISASFLRVVALGGELFPYQRIKTIADEIELGKLKVYNLYGVTEQSSWSFLHQVDFSTAMIPLGEAVPGTSYKVTDGILYLGGNRKCFINDELPPDWICTGDVVETDTKGNLCVVGRENNDIRKEFGKKVSCNLVKSLLHEYFGVDSVVKLSENFGLEVYVIASDKDIEEQEIRSTLRRSLESHYKIISVATAPPQSLSRTAHDKFSFEYKPIDVAPVELNPSNVVLLLKEWLRLREIQLYDNTNIFLLALGLDSLDIMCIAGFLLQHLSGLSLRISKDEVYSVLIHNPINEISLKLPEAVQKNCCSVALSDSNSVTILSKYFLNLCVDGSPAVFQHPDSNHVPNICIGSHSGDVVCFRISEGISRVAWQQKLPSRVECTPCYSTGYVYIGCYDHHIYVMSGDDGRIIRSIKTGDQVKCSPVADGVDVYCGSHDSFVYKLSQGELQAKFGGWNAFIGASPVILSNNIIICDYKGCIRSYAKQNLDEIVWYICLASPIFSTPVHLDASQKMIVAEVKGVIHVINSANGTILYSKSTSGSIHVHLRALGDQLYGVFDNKIFRYSINLQGQINDDSYIEIPVSEISLSTKPILISADKVIIINTEGEMFTVNFVSRTSERLFCFPCRIFSNPAIITTTDQIMLTVGCRDNYCYVISINSF